MKNMTKREKFLLTFLIVAVVVVGYVYFMLMPALRDYQTAYDENQSAIETKQAMEVSLAEVQVVDKRYEDILAIIEAEYNRYNDVILQNDFLEYIRAYSEENNMDSKSLSVTQYNMPLNNPNDGTTIEAVVTSQGEERQLSGTMEGFIAMLDAISRSNDLRALKFTIQEGMENFNVSYTLYSKGNITYKGAETDTAKPEAPDTNEETLDDLLG